MMIKECFDHFEQVVRELPGIVEGDAAYRALLNAYSSGVADGVKVAMNAVDPGVLAIEIIELGVSAIEREIDARMAKENASLKIVI